MAMASSNPFASLEPALRALAESMDVLPATGQAQEYLQQFDIDEVYDRIRMAEDRLVTRIMERPNSELYVPLAPLPRAEDHVFRFFLDGASRTQQRDRLEAGQVRGLKNGVEHRTHVGRKRKRC